MMQFTIELDFSLFKKVALHVFSHNYAKMKVDSSLILCLYKKKLTLCMSVFNEDQNHYYYNIFLE